MSRALLRTSAPVLILLASLVAGSAGAVSSIDLVWNQPGLPTAYEHAPSSTATALIVLRGDVSDGYVYGFQLTVLFDTTELDFISMKEHEGPAASAGMTNQFAPLNSGNTVVDEAAGVVTGFDSATVGNGCLGCTITLGSIRFHVVGSNGGAGDDDVVMGLVTATDGAVREVNQLFTPDFGAVQNGVPEPSATALIGAGLLGLVRLSRPRRAL